MKRISTLLATLCLMQSGHAQTITTAVPGLISYQGRALNSAGTVMGSGTPVNRTVTFRIWDHASNSLTANLIYSEQQVVTIAEGEFSVLVGAGSVTAGTPLGYSETAKGPPTLKINDLSVFAGVNRFLGVTIDDGTVAVDNEVSPRQQIVSSAYALRARYAEQLGSNGGTALTALDSGNVGIGNTNPPSRFTVTAAGTGTSTPQMIVTADDVTERLRIGVDSSGTGTGYIQSFKEGIGAQNLLLNPNGGNVGIGSGNTNPAVALSVTGAITATGAITGGSITSAAGSLTTNTGNIGIGTTTPTARLDIIDGTTAGTYGSVQISRPANGHTGSHMAFVRAGGQVMGLGYGQSSPTFGLGGVGPQNVFTPNILSIDSISNVGIGTASPGYKLDVRGNGRFTDTLTTDAPIVMGPGSQIYGSAVAGVSKPVFWPRAADDATYLNIGSNGWYVRDDANNVTMRLTSGGRLGLGTSTPTNLLQVQAPVSAQVATNAVAAGNAVAAIGASDAGLHFGTYNNTNGYGSWIQSMRTWDNYSFNLVLNPNGGNVGIGTSLPGYPLSVAPKVNVAYTQAAVTHNNNNFTPQLGNADGYTAAGPVGMNGQTWQTSIYAEGVVAGSAFVATSDLRIKDIVNRSSTRSDLALINQLQVTDYRLKDSIGNGKSIRKGFIAQEVRKIIPEAVSPSPNFIPDIYVLATQSVYDAAQKHLSVTLAKPHALVVGEWVRIYGDDNTMETKVLTVESATSFTVASEKPMAKAFVYGRRVDDFLTVDYDRLFTTGIGATQELARKLETVQAENAALRRELAAKEESMEARLIALEARLPKDSAPAPVSLKTVSTSK
jgi:hypothetical protein